MLEQTTSDNEQRIFVQKRVKTSESNWNVRKVKRYKLVYCGVLSSGARIVLEVAGGGWWYGNTDRYVMDQAKFQARGPNIGPCLVTTGLELHTHIPRHTNIQHFPPDSQLLTPCCTDNMFMVRLIFDIFGNKSNNWNIFFSSKFFLNQNNAVEVKKKLLEKWKFWKSLVFASVAWLLSLKRKTLFHHSPSWTPFSPRCQDGPFTTNISPIRAVQGLSNCNIRGYKLWAQKPHKNKTSSGHIYSWVHPLIPPR